MQAEKNKKCVVIGLGASGMAAAQYLRDRGFQVGVSESADLSRISGADCAELARLGITLESGGHSENFFRDAALVVPSPGVPLDLPILEAVRQRGVEIAGELALAAGQFHIPVIAVTGSNGKTTTTSLIGHLLKEEGRRVFVGGNIGTPLLEYFRGPLDAETVVLELSSFQLEMSGSFRPDIGLLLNISPDHLDRHGSMESYGAAKKRIFENQRPGDIAIVGADDPLLAAERRFSAGTLLRFGSAPGCEALVTGGGVVLRGRVGGEMVHEEYSLQETILSAEINRQNAAAAILAVRAAGCGSEAVRSGLLSFKLPRHRMALVAEINGIRYIDDSKGTNIGAVAAALSSCGGPVILIAGGRSKGGDFRLLAPAVAEHVRLLVLIGEAATRMAAELGPLVPTVLAAKMEEAVQLAAAAARPGDTVLLSPACASFDMFSGYAERGEVFQRAVEQLENFRQDCRSNG